MLKHPNVTPQITDLLGRASDITGRNYTGLPVVVEWNLKGRSRLGTCEMMRLGGRVGFVLHLSPAYCAALGVDRYADTVTHELCHAIVGYERYTLKLHNDGGHGPRWRYWMRTFGLRPDVCADVPQSVTSSVPKARRTNCLVASCGCPDRKHDLALGSRGRGTNLINGAVYVCVTCWSTLRDTGIRTLA